MALFREERSFPVSHYRRNEQVNGLSCFGVYQLLTWLVMMGERTSYRLHHVNIMSSIGVDVDIDGDDNYDDKIFIVTHWSLVTNQEYQFLIFFVIFSAF